MLKLQKNLTSAAQPVQWAGQCTFCLTSASCTAAAQYSRSTMLLQNREASDDCSRSAATATRPA